MVAKKCARCGATFGLTKQDGRITLCKKCHSSSSYVLVKREFVDCKLCNKRFKQNRKDQLFCCAECRSIWYKKEYNRLHQNHNKECKWCHQEFITTDKTKEYCSYEHYREAKNHRARKSYQDRKKVQDRK